MKAKEYIWKILETDDEEKEKELGEVMIKCLKHMKYCDKKEYKDLERELYIICYGHHLSDEMCEEWVSCMINKDGSKGEHWSKEETTTVARQYNIDLTDHTAGEWYATLNMIYSDYYGVVPNDVNTYVRMAKAFLLDEDAGEHKLFNYYMCVVK